MAQFFGASSKNLNKLRHFPNSFNHSYENLIMKIKKMIINFNNVKNIDILTINVELIRD